MDDQPVRILLVEDDPDDVWMLRSLLADRWEGPYELIHVEFLSEALECCGLGGVDVLLLDLSLPDSRGLETFLRVSSHSPDTPIVILTDLNDESMAVKAVQAGAEDYLVKSQVNDATLLRSIRYGIERNRRRQVEQAQRFTTEDHRAAQEIQRRLTPGGSPVLESFELAGAVFPAKNTAGDYFDYFPLTDGTLAIALGDISSKGAYPTLVMAETRACLRTLGQIVFDVGEMLARTNRFLASDHEHTHLVSLALLRLDVVRRSLVYASAGQRGYLADSARRTWSVLESTCMPLGINDDISVLATPPIPLQPGQLVVFFTDGVSDAESADQARFGVERALDVLGAAAELPAREMIDELHVAVKRFCRPALIRDDIAVVVLKAARVEG